MASSVLTKAIFFLIALVVLLQIIHMILLYQLESIKLEKYAIEKEKNYLELRKLELDKTRVRMKIEKSHVLDSSGQYHIINNLLNTYELDQNNLLLNDQSNDLTLVTQCSPSRLYYIEDLLHAYHGPISLSIFTLSQNIPNIVNVLILLRKCLPLFREYVKVHLVYPLTSDSFSIKLPNIDSTKLSCLTLSHQLASFRKHKDEFRHYGEGDGIAFPVNLLRNVARRNVKSNYILVIDIDLIPSKSLRKDFNAFIKQSTIKLKEGKSVNLNKEQFVFVLPVYEMDINIGNIGSNLADAYKEEEIVEKKPNENDINAIKKNEDSMEDNDLDYPEYLETIKLKKHHLGINLGNIVGKNFGTNYIPANKTALLDLIRKKLIRPFYYELCYKCQKSTNYEEWQLLGEDSQLNAVLEIEYQDPYEPFYIALNSDSLPFYDERFKQYGFNRISNVCELHIAGFRFLLLNNHFLVHKGKKHLVNYNEAF